ncbi:DNA repair protein rhp26 [Penicillium argentinense]|uniref:DNA repair protein rhp26 n=1 Tax=Penicillium argentinense TaxID=1131581 RepID=A0A9W9K2E9_9EURO|nr:DNA repair protein rhp26 [Penicillium argentinense]KAJ5090568.1 DNA repair protein rhp26 [Penicillium argentinense]
MAPANTNAEAAAETRRLKELNADVRDQEDLERDITKQADKILLEKAEENDSRRLESALLEKEKAEALLGQARARLNQHVSGPTRRRLESEVKKQEARRTERLKDIKDITDRIDERRKTAEENMGGITGPGRLPNETRRDYLLRTGKITPFELMNATGPEGLPSHLEDALVDVEDQHDEREEKKKPGYEPEAHRHLHRPGMDFGESSGESSQAEGSRKRRKLSPQPKKESIKSRTAGSSDVDSSASYVASEDDHASSEDEEEFMPDTIPESTAARKRKQDKTGAEKDLEDLSGLDDGNEKLYQKRLQDWISRRSTARKRAQGDEEADEVDDDRSEWLKPHPTEPDMELNGLRVPGDVSRFLFSYQKTGVQWLWELHQQSVGGIIGDEMGLGKTIQTIAYLASLHHSDMFTKPAIVVCPATLMKQWVNEFHRWWPAFRVSILHSSGSGMMNLGKESSREDALTSAEMDTHRSRGLTAGQKAARKIINRVTREGHVLVTTYSGLQSYADALVGVEWGCAILDEGHKIRNPDAGITFSCKELRTPHRIILSGTPMQNSLVDLWSLFDFVFPLRLGTLVSFKNSFEIPIRQGGYSMATNLQIQTAAKCAETLKNAISPYLLQRFKADVAADLPQKTEQVIFCKITPIQRTAYRRFLDSDDMKSIIRGRRNSLFGIDILRKICNHPDLADHKLRAREADYGQGERSGKMQVLKGLLEVWKDTGHKTLLFAQTRQMLDIIQKFLQTLGGFTYRRMDGSTPIKLRQQMVDEFNKDPDIHVFLLTTRVGGIGVNLTGANRVIIFDPDWNPSTDMQARERAWRLGQKRDVTIFRLMTKGTIEEKIYHRQVFKQFLTNKITRDPHQREGFELSDLYDLFTLADENDNELETEKRFKNAEVTFKEEKKEGPKKGTWTKPSSSEAPAEDVTAVEGVANVEEFKTTGDDAEKEDNAKTAEDRIMHGIFSRTGVHSAVEHDQIVNGKRVLSGDRKMIEAAARRVAAESEEALRKAEEEARSVPIGLPTWTGRFGVAGRSENRGGSSARPTGGPSSSNLLANLNPSATLGGPSTPATTRMPRGNDFIPMIKEFLESRRGKAFTQNIVDHFNPYCVNDQRVAEFQSRLKSVATLSRDRAGRGVWTLKK